MSRFTVFWNSIYVIKLVFGGTKCAITAVCNSKLPAFFKYCGIKKLLLHESSLEEKKKMWPFDVLVQCINLVVHESPVWNYSSSQCEPLNQIFMLCKFVCIFLSQSKPRSTVLFFELCSMYCLCFIILTHFTFALSDFCLSLSLTPSKKHNSTFFHNANTCVVVVRAESCNIIFLLCIPPPKQEHQSLFSHIFWHVLPLLHSRCNSLLLTFSFLPFFSPSV